ncbi:hypothetical protein PF003_g9718 [Phytophthora fragariae]|nr:hypothetical protein PF003_g9718 [Phytophthora fragariae]
MHGGEGGDGGRAATGAGQRRMQGGDGGVAAGERDGRAGSGL